MDDTPEGPLLGRIVHTSPQPTMRAVIADTALRRYALSAAGQALPGRYGKRAGWGRGGIVRYEDALPVPALPRAGGWLRVRPELAGVCGSDLGIARAKESPRLSAFWTAQRQVLGHEVVGVVTETGPGVTRVREGERIVLDPVIACAQRGFEDLCRECRDGHPFTCERFPVPVSQGAQSEGASTVMARREIAPRAQPEWECRTCQPLRHRDPRPLQRRRAARW